LSNFPSGSTASWGDKDEMRSPPATFLHIFVAKIRTYAKIRSVRHGDTVKDRVREQAFSAGATVAKAQVGPPPPTQPYTPAHTGPGTGWPPPSLPSVHPVHHSP
jgi:hypothetical protein